MAEENVTNKNETEEIKSTENDKKKKNAAVRKWLKVPAMIVCILSVFGVLISGAGMLVMWADNLQADEIQPEMEEVLLEVYGSILVQDTGMLAETGVKGGLDGLDGGSIRYTVTDSSYGEKEKVLYSNDSDINRENCRVALSTADKSINYMYGYNTGSYSQFLASIWKGEGHYINHFDYNEAIQEFVFAKDQGLFYCHTVDEYFLLPEFSLCVYDHEDDIYNYKLTEKDGKYCYVTEDKNIEDKVVDAKTIEEWMDGDYGILVQDEYVSWSVADSKDFQDVSVMEYGKDYINYNASVYEGVFYCELLPGTDEKIYSIYLSLGDIEPGKRLNNGVKDYFWNNKKLSNYISAVLRYHGVLLVIFILLFAISFFYLLAESGKRDEENRLVLRTWDKIPLEIFTVLVGGLFLFVLCAIDYGSMDIAEFVLFSPVVGIAIIAFLIWLFIAYWMSITTRIKAKKFWHYTVIYLLFNPFRTASRVLRNNIPLFLKGIFILTAVTFCEIFVLSLNDFETIYCCFFLYKVVEYLLLIRVLYQIDQIDKGGMRTAAGDYSRPVPTRYMFHEFKRIAENINHVSDGISLAVEEKMKSERFKTELITNVSHDIKTPLTSIINYVDLIKKEEIADTVMQEYVEVLDRQSLRLKKLIEDLMEASKASTGNLPVHMELCDATVMLTQVIGEFKERAEQNQLELVVESPNPPVSIMADGRHLWRVIDNLMSNICKYAMPGTRVYITLEQFHGMVIMTFRNISRSRLNISSEELMERFVRGDSSRNTEGSGLGLSIAQSLTGLMDGNMAIQIDGDLFKAIVSFEEVVKK